MAGGAKAHHYALIQNVIDTSHAGDGDRQRVEQFLPAGHRIPRFLAGSGFGEIGPFVEDGKGTGVERCSGWVSAERIVDAEEERLRGETVWPALRSLLVETSGRVIARLRCKQRRLESYHLRRLLV